MKFAAKAPADFEIAPAGNHIAICNAIIDLGLQPGRGQYPDPKPQVYLRFELPTERLSYEKDGKTVEGPMCIGRDFTASMSEKANLRKFIESWFGKRFPSDDAAADFDCKLLLGKRCLLNVTHSERGGKRYANINTATPIPKGMQADQAQHNSSLYFDLNTADQATFDKLPKWLQKRIEGRIVEQQPKSNGHDERNPPSNDFDDDSDIPF